MKSLTVRLIFPLSFLLLSILPLRAEAVSFSLSPLVERLGGSNSYRIEFSDTARKTYRSELVFPLDTTLFGGELELELGTAVKPSWGFSVGVKRNLSDPSTPMTDSDWKSVIPDGPLFLYSYTESTSLLDYSEVEAAVRRIVFSGFVTEVFLRLGFRYRSISETIPDYYGWELVQIPGTTDYGIGIVDSEIRSPNQDAIEYRLSLYEPSAAAVLEIQAFPFLEVALSGSLGLVFASDIDNHLLRRKLSTAAGIGLGRSLSLFARFNAPFRSAGAAGEREAYSCFLELGGRWEAAGVETAQLQEWYGGGTAENGGGRNESVPYSLQIETLRLTVSAGIDF